MQSNEKKAEINYSLKENINYTGSKEDNIFKIFGDSETGNLNPRLRNNIHNCLYFKELYIYKTYHEVIDEIVKSATHAEPWVGFSLIFFF